VLVVDVGVHDIAWRTVRARGLTRFMAACMLAGYGWAVVSALVWIVGGPALDGYRYDIVVHSLTIGFVMSMILAHAPVIVPALARRPLPYHPVMWAVWGLLHVGLLVRVVSGARGAVGGWQLGGTLSVVALLAFLASTVTLVVRGSGPVRVVRRADDERADDPAAAADDPAADDEREPVR
jgi:nitrite reductase (NO-forming)